MLEFGAIMPISLLMGKDGHQQNFRQRSREVNVFLETDVVGTGQSFFLVQVCHKAVTKEGLVFETRQPGISVEIEITI